MYAHPREMKLLTATLAGCVLFVVSCLLLWAADEAMELAAIAGGTGVVISGALLGLTFLAWRWRGDVAYSRTVVDQSGFYDELESTFDEDAPLVEPGDAAAV